MPTKVLTMPAPNEKQARALAERHRYVGYGGARGGGKSWFVRWKAVLLCLFEVTFLRFVLAFERTTAIIGYRKKKNSWGRIERKKIQLK